MSFNGRVGGEESRTGRRSGSGASATRLFFLLFALSIYVVSEQLSVHQIQAKKKAEEKARRKKAEETQKPQVKKSRIPKATPKAASAIVKQLVRRLSRFFLNVFFSNPQKRPGGASLHKASYGEMCMARATERAKRVLREVAFPPFSCQVHFSLFSLFYSSSQTRKQEAARGLQLQVVCFFG